MRDRFTTLVFIARRATWPTAYPVLAAVVTLALATASCSWGRPGSDGGVHCACAADGADSQAQAALSEEDMSILFDTPVNTLGGETSSLAALEGKALLIVNVASKCGLTPQYADLEKLHEEYAARGFSVVGFPCNQFGGQEPGSAEEIQTFCSTTYGVTFPMFEKIEVNGAGRHPIYQALTKIEDGDGEAGDIKWNFEKFVVSADGKSVKRFRPMTSPYDPDLVAAVEAALP
jgi:glutathione peroxidase